MVPTSRWAFSIMFGNPLASWTVLARIVPYGDGSTFLMTLFQPGALDDKAFNEAATELDTELAKLKEILEQETGVFTVSPNL